MDKVGALIRAKPRIFVYISVAYLLCVCVIKWLTAPSLEALWFFLGGVIGIYFLDAAEAFFALNPSPFRSIVFAALFYVVAFFAVTSSTSAIGSGLVLSLYLQILLWQVGEWRVSGNLHSWFGVVSEPVNVPTQRGIFIVSILLFLVESYIFIR